MSTSDAPKPLRFYRAGGLDQMLFETGSDIAALGRLDRKLWVALACPVKGLEFDERTLSLIDTDGDGRVRAAEVVSAVEFLEARLRPLDTLLAGSEALALAAINDATPEGQATLASARLILSNLGREGADAITFSDVADRSRYFTGTRLNGDGVITPASTDDAEVAGVLVDIMATHGAVVDRSGRDGASRAAIENFYKEAKALDAWLASAATDPAIQPLGTQTAVAYAAVCAVRAKVDDFFARTKVAAFDARALRAVNRAEEDYLAASARDLSVTAEEIAGFPLARIEPERPLPLDGGLNPAWAGAVAELRARALLPLLGELRVLTEEQWQEIKRRLASHAAWAAGRPSNLLGSLADARVQSILASDAEAKLLDLLTRDEALAVETAGMDAVEKLVRLNRDFFRLLNNFVSFGDFYSRKRAASFQAGRLFLDSRECTLCFRVEDPAKHAVLAGSSKCYLAYCEVSRNGGTEKMSILAVFTQGDSDFLTVGRNGLFVDRKGQDWDATVTRIIDAPISIRQAFLAPYKKFLRMIEEQVAKRAATAESASDAKLATHAEAVANADKTVTKPPAASAAATTPAAGPKKLDLGMIALVGTAISGVAAMAGLVLEKFFGLGLYMPLGLLAIVLLISGPSMLIAALKLRQRSLGPVLDAGGWAINGRVLVNIPFGTALTHLAKLPKGSSLSLQDPFAEKKSSWPTMLVFTAMIATGIYIAYDQGWLGRWLMSFASE